MITTTPQPMFKSKFTNDPKAGLTQEQLDFLDKVVAARREARRTTATGPTTPEGKAISAQNARKHGFSGANMVITDEDRPAYIAHVESYMAAFQPQNQPQADAVRLIANAMWRTDRLSTIETSLLELEIAWNSPYTDVYIGGLEERHYTAIAFLQHTEGSNALDLCRRYLSSAQRDYQRAIAAFEKLKQLTTAVAIPQPIEKPQETAPEPVIQPDPEPVQQHQKLHLVQKDPNELPQTEPSDSASTYNNEKSRQTSFNEGRKGNSSSGHGTDKERESA